MVIIGVKIRIPLMLEEEYKSCNELYILEKM